MQIIWIRREEQGLGSAICAVRKRHVGALTYVLK